MSRQINESPITQGEDESLVYSLTTTPWGSDPTAVSVTVWDVTDADETDDWTDVTDDVMPGVVPPPSGDVITLPAITNLTDAHVYRIEIQFTCDGNTFETYGFIIGGE